MLLGFISLLMTVFQGSIVKICVPADIMKHLLPCSLSSKPGGEESHSPPEASGHRRLLAEGAAAGGYCAAKVILMVLGLFPFGLSCKFVMF